MEKGIYLGELSPKEAGMIEEIRKIWQSILRGWGGFL